jgi:hypothetical protein
LEDFGILIHVREVDAVDDIDVDVAGMVTMGFVFQDYWIWVIGISWSLLDYSWLRAAETSS